MIVAISERSKATWFFKLMGRVNQIEELESEWQSIIQSISYSEDGEPQWTTPDGWKDGPARQMRFATLQRSLADGTTVEISISSLGPNQNLLDNVNRWLGQLNLPQISDSQMKLGSIDSQAGKLKIFDEIGETSIPRTSTIPVTAPLNYDIPDGWQPGESNTMVAVRLRYGDAADAPQITVTKLLARANEWLPNAERWALQVGEDTAEDYVNSKTNEVTVDGIKGNQLRLFDKDPKKKSGLIGVMIVRDEFAWFFKMFGSREQIAELESDFSQFLSSVRFR